jgi:hypothetical protein
LVLDKTSKHLMHCYFLHQENHEEIMAQCEDLPAGKRCQCNVDVQELTEELENAHRKLKVSCLHT